MYALAHDDACERVFVDDGTGMRLVLQNTVVNLLPSLPFLRPATYLLPVVTLRLFADLRLVVVLRLVVPLRLLVAPVRRVALLLAPLLVCCLVCWLEVRVVAFLPFLAVPPKVAYLVPMEGWASLRFLVLAAASRQFAACLVAPLLGMAAVEVVALLVLVVVATGVVAPLVVEEVQIADYSRNKMRQLVSVQIVGYN